MKMKHSLCILCMYIMVYISENEQKIIMLCV